MAYHWTGYWFFYLKGIISPTTVDTLWDELQFMEVNSCVTE